MDLGHLENPWRSSRGPVSYKKSSRGLLGSRRVTTLSGSLWGLTQPPSSLSRSFCSPITAPAGTQTSCQDAASGTRAPGHERGAVSAPQEAEAPSGCGKSLSLRRMVREAGGHPPAAPSRPIPSRPAEGASHLYPRPRCPPRARRD